MSAASLTWEYSSAELNGLIGSLRDCSRASSVFSPNASLPTMLMCAILATEPSSMSIASATRFLSSGLTSMSMRLP